MNYGSFSEDTYTKKVSFSKAVLWHTRQLSLRRDIIDEIKARGIKKIVFADRMKAEMWIFKPEKVFEHMELKRVGQEHQYYFPIDLAKKEPMQQREKPKYVFDSIKQMYVEV